MSVLKFQTFRVGQISDETKRGRSVLSEIWSGSFRRFMGQIADKFHPSQDKQTRKQNPAFQSSPRSVGLTAEKRQLNQS